MIQIVRECDSFGSKARAAKLFGKAIRRITQGRYNEAVDYGMQGVSILMYLGAIPNQ